MSDIHDVPIAIALASRAFLDAVGQGRSVLNRSTGDTIFDQGAEALSIFYIQSGCVKLTVMSELGKEAIVAVLGPGYFFGEACLGEIDRRTSTAVALEECIISVISKPVMIEALKSDIDLSQLFLAHVLRRTARTEEDLVDQLFNSSEKRLARLLLRLAEYAVEGKPQIVPVTLKQEELAEMIGATRSRVSHFMAKFRRLGYISYNGKIEVHHSLLRAMLADKPNLGEE